ncbi:YncE family protein [Mycobacterium sp. pUA109]|uniref:YncE family protein n=1 Tax=Mycobacterium sp. pUA109 TaxID=3238982 RepID=UPI00351AF772
MAKAVTAMSEARDATGGVALAEPPSSAPTVRIPALQDLAVNLGPRSHRYLPDVLAEAGPLLEVGVALGLTVAGRIGVGNGPIAGIAASRDGRRLVVTNYGDDSISVVNLAAGRVAATLTGLPEPFTVAADEADEARVYVGVASPGYDAIAAVDLVTGTAVAGYPLAGSVRDLAVSPDGKLVFTSRISADGADVVVLDTTTEQAQVIDLAVAPGAVAENLAVSPDGQRLYVAIQRPDGSGLAVIDTAARRVLDTIEIGSPIRGLALNHDGDILYVASCDPDLGAVIDVVDTRAAVITGSLEIGSLDTVTQLLLSTDGARAYLVTGTGVTVMSTLTHDVIGTVALDAQPSCVAESADGSHLYVADHAGAVTVVSIGLTTASLVGEVADRPELFELETALV